MRFSRQNFLKSAQKRFFDLFLLPPPPLPRENPRSAPGLRQYLYRQSAEKLIKKIDLTASAANLIKLNISQLADKPNEN